MKKQDVWNLNQYLHSVGNLVGVKFAYGVARNIALIKPEIEALVKSLEPLPAYLKYDEERMALAKASAVKDPTDQPITRFVENRTEYVIADQKAFDTAIVELKLKYKETLEIRETQVEEYNKLLKEDVEVNLFKISIDDVPKEISVNQMIGISEIIKEA